MIQVKICGLSDEAGVDAAVAGGADWLGFVFFARSPRAVTPERAASLARRHPGAAPAVGLFVRPLETEIAACLEHVPMAALQLYEVPERAHALGRRFGLPVWLACPVASHADLPRQQLAERLLLESRPPAQAERPGGNGLALDWSLLRDWQAPGDWMLAGGLTPANVAGAITASGARAVDVSSGVESSPGVKDPGLITAFLHAARRSGDGGVGAAPAVG